MALIRALLLLLPALLAGCGDLPRPFAGNPGATALRLAQPPPARLAVPTPTAALLPEAAGSALAAALASALQEQEVPAVAEPPRAGDWRLVTSAELRGTEVVPVFTVQNPAGEDQGASQGAAIASAAWAEGAPALLQGVAKTAAPNIASLLTSIEAARRESDPNSLVNRPVRVFFKGVHGAPGDGDASLARQIRTQLPGLGPVVQDSESGADFVLEGKVVTERTAGNMMQVEIQWRLDDAAGPGARPGGATERSAGRLAGPVLGRCGGGGGAGGGGRHPRCSSSSRPARGTRRHNRKGADARSGAATGKLAAGGVAEPSCASWTAPPGIARSRAPPLRDAA